MGRTIIGVGSNSWFFRLSSCSKTYSTFFTSREGHVDEDPRGNIKWVCITLLPPTGTYLHSYRRRCGCWQKTVDRGRVVSHTIQRIVDFTMREFFQRTHSKTSWFNRQFIDFRRKSLLCDQIKMVWFDLACWKCFKNDWWFWRSKN